MLFDTAASKAKFNALEPPVNSCLERIATAAVSVSKEIMERKEARVSPRKPAQKYSQFRKNESVALREHRTKQVFQLLRAFLTVYTYALRKV